MIYTNDTYGVIRTAEICSVVRISHTTELITYLPALTSTYQVSESYTLLKDNSMLNLSHGLRSTRS